MREFMDEEMPDRSAPEVCRLLRTKTAFGNQAGGAIWQRGESTTAVFWCLATMTSTGPDERIAHAHDCREGRACFRRST